MTGAAPERATAIEAAVALLTLAMRESHGPVETMGSALERMAAALSRCARTLERQGRSEPSLRDLEACQAALERDIALCIESLQFHDRLMQRLARVGEHLAGASDGEHPACEMRRVSLSEGSIELF